MGGIAVAQLLPMAATTASRVSQSYLGRGRGIWGPFGREAVRAT